MLLAILCCTLLIARCIRGRLPCNEGEHCYSHVKGKGNNRCPNVLMPLSYCTLINLDLDVIAPVILSCCLCYSICILFLIIMLVRGCLLILRDLLKLLFLFCYWRNLEYLDLQTRCLSSLTVACKKLESIVLIL